MTFAADILAQLNSTIVTLNRLTTAGSYPTMSPREREDALLQLRLSTEVLNKLGEIARLETLATGGSAPEPATPAWATPAPGGNNTTSRGASGRALLPGAAAAAAAGGVTKGA